MMAAPTWSLFSCLSFDSDSQGGKYSPDFFEATGICIQITVTPHRLSSGAAVGQAE